MSDDVPIPAAGEAQPPAANGGNSNGAPPTGDAGTPEPKPRRYVAGLSSEEDDEPTELPVEFAEAVLELEKLLKMPVWLLIQDGAGHDLCPHMEEMFFRGRNELPQGKPIALLIESPGGSAEAAYSIAKLLQRRCGSFVAVIANWAKSAATLLALGASEIILAEHGQLGPLDVQLYDPAREEQNSALNETQALERLHAAGLEALVDTLYALRAGLRSPRYGNATKKFETLLPHAVKFVAESMRPLYEKVDVVQYTARLRDLKVAEEYAVRLLSPNYAPHRAKQLASALVEDYPDHGFIIDFGEAKTLGMHVKEPTLEQPVQLDKILHHITTMNAFGRVVAT
jgi:hypothetical protein